ncbi:MAG: outer membrane beta-barrel family protein [Muribaculaceae bacterium]|nr:outer membrane beta-barrel family protein [Muribaculaceae bacterium]
MTIVMLSIGFNLHAYIERKDFIVVDAETNDNLPGCEVKLINCSGKILFHSTTNQEGGVSIDKSLLAESDSIRFILISYIPVSISSVDPPSTVRLQPLSRLLGEVQVTSSRIAYQQTPQAITYNLDADPVIKDKTLWDAIGRTPFLFTTPTGSVSAIPGYSGVEYRLNGLEDPLLDEGNRFNLFSSFPARNIKKIEVSELFTADGIKLRVNIVTKGHIEGINGSIASRLNDDSWNNTLYLLTKIKRFTASLSYSNYWSWDHSSISDIAETRTDNTSIPILKAHDTDHGYRVDTHTSAFSASYILSDRIILSGFGTLWLKSDPHTIFSGSGLVEDKTTRLLEYSYTGNSRSPKDIEYNLGTSLQHYLKSKGSITAKYQFYQRRRIFIEDRKYNLICNDSLYDRYGNLFPDFHKIGEENMRIHTLQFKLDKPMARQNHLSAEAWMRYYLDSSDQDDRYGFNDNIWHIGDLFRHRQMTGYIRGEYEQSFDDKYYISGALHMYLYDNRMTYDRQQHFSKTFINVSPSVIARVLTSQNSNISLTYEMSRLMPSAFALNPYQEYEAGGTIRYGNPNLTPERRHQFNLRYTYFLGNNILQLTSANRFSSNLMLNTVFLSEGLLHSTVANAASRIENSLSAYFQHRNKGLFFKIFSSANYVNYNAYRNIEGIGTGRNGWYWNNQASISYDFGQGWSADASANANTRYIYFQSKGDANYSYGIALTKYLLANRLIISISCRNPLPVHKTIFTDTEAIGFSRTTNYRSYTASFGISVRYRFGSLRASVKGDTDDISRSDIKSSYGQ